MDSLQLLVLWDKPSSSKDQSRASAEITATLNGIHIQGARMASGVGIDECYPDTPSWNLIPHCYLSWLPVDDVVRTTSIVFIRLRIFFFNENLPVVVCRSLLGPMGCIPWKCHCMLTKNDSVWLLFSTYLLLVVWLTTGTELGLLYHSKIEILVSTSFLSTIPIDTYVFSDLARIHRSHLLKYLFLYPLVPQERNYSPTYHVFR